MSNSLVMSKIASKKCHVSNLSHVKYRYKIIYVEELSLFDLVVKIKEAGRGARPL
jgi:hypothetical protein